ncbi:MAG TPA: hypothetical protein PLM75_04230 [bacterium]|nr:hypothetical protein [bacterium]
MVYSKKLFKHFFCLQNVGEIENADDIGEISSVNCLILNSIIQIVLPLVLLRRYYLVIKDYIQRYF